MRCLMLLLGLLLPAVSTCQWSQVTVPTTTDLLSVHSVGDSVWVSGTQGTVLHSSDGGMAWTRCAVPAGLAHTDLLAIQGIDASTAVVMTSGKGEQSRLFRTADGCKTWTLVFSNPEETSSFDSLRRVTARQLYLLGEPVLGKFAMYLSQDAGATWFIADDPGLDAGSGETATGSTLTAQGAFLYFGTGGAKPMIHFTYAKCNPATPDAGCALAWGRSAASDTAGAIRGIAVRTQTSMNGSSTNDMVAVGRTQSPRAGLAAYAHGENTAWHLADRPTTTESVAVAFDGASQAWIAVGPSGTELSNDGGRHWLHAKAATASTVPDADWTAVSLPFVVGKHGAVGKLDRSSFKP